MEVSDPVQHHQGVLERMQELQAKGEQLTTSLKQREDALRAKIAEQFPPSAIEVEVRFDEAGLLEQLTIDNPLPERPADQYQRTINTAILVAQASDPHLPAEAALALLDALSAGEQPPSTRVTDDDGNVTVVASFGDIRVVELSPRWVQLSTDTEIAEQIVRVAQRAARASDTYHRFE
jgi:hypothetical protein